MSKKPHDIGKIATKFMAVILVILMILGVSGTLIYYLVTV